MRVLIVGVCLLMAVFAWSNDQLIEAVSKACPAKNYMCPKKEFGLFDGFQWKWDIDAVISAPAAENFRKAKRLNEGVLASLISTYCCREGPCLFRCGIFPRNEIDLIKSFPANAEDILDLNLPELEKHRAFISMFVKKQRVPDYRRGRQPAQLEEFFDDVHLHQDKIRQRLQNNQ